MIIVRISGGLGNQLFQYSLARAIKERTGLEVKLDTEYYSHQKPGDAPRQFLLEQFKINVPIATIQDLEKIGFAEAHEKKLVPLLLRKTHVFLTASNHLIIGNSLLSPHSPFIKRCWR